MLNKATIIHELSMARIAHERWIKRVEHLISGMPVDHMSIPVESTVCRFGKWYYGSVGETLKGFFTFKPTMEQIEVQHNQLHAVYHEIYNLYFIRPKQRTFFQKFIMLRGEKLSKEEYQKAKENYQKLQDISAELVRLINKLEKAIRAADLILLYRNKVARASAVS